MLKGGRSLERNVSLRSGRSAQEALQRLGHEVVAIDVGPELVEQLREAEPDVAFIALHGRDGEDGTVQGCWSRSAPLHRLRAGRVHALHRQGAREAPDARGRHPDARFRSLQARAPIKELGAPRVADLERSSASRWSSSPPARARRSA